MFLGLHSLKTIEKNFQRLKTIEDVTNSYIEERINHEVIADLFPNVSAPSKEQALFLGGILKEAWSSKLARDFPDRRFVVSFPIYDEDKVCDYEITFFQDADDKTS